MLDAAFPRELPVDSSEEAALEGTPVAPAQLSQGEARQPKMVGFWAAVAFAVVCALCDFGLAPAFVRVAQGSPGVEAAWFFVMLGCTLAQGNMLAAWLAWSEGPFARRLLIHWSVAGGLYGLWGRGLALTYVSEDAGMVRVIVPLAVPLVSLAAQIPPWLTRQWLGWRLVRVGEGAQVGSERQLTIRGLMAATVVVAVALALARLVPTIQGGKEFWAAWTVAFVMAAVISTVGILPAGRMLLGIRRWRLAMALSSAYAAALIGLVWTVRELVIRYASNSGPPTFAYVFLSSLMLGYAVTLIGAGSVARALGYRLVRERDREPARLNTN